MMMRLLILAGLLPALMIGGSGCTDTAAPAGPVPDSHLDTAPPAIPTGLWAAATARTSVKLAWNANTTDLDLQGYQVYRLAFGQSIPLTDTPVTEAKFIDAAPLDGPCIYAVTSLDTNGNESGWVQVRYNFEREEAELRSATN